MITKGLCVVGMVEAIQKPRRVGEGLLIGNNIKITVEKISKGQIKIGIEAPMDVVVAREEVVKEINE